MQSEVHNDKRIVMFLMDRWLVTTVKMAAKKTVAKKMAKGKLAIGKTENETQQYRIFNANEMY